MKQKKTWDTGKNKVEKEMEVRKNVVRGKRATRGGQGGVLKGGHKR